MKNLFVILAVIAMVSFASAASVSLVPSATEVTSGTTVTISLVSSGLGVTALTIDAIKDSAANTQGQGGLTMATILTVGRAIGSQVNNGSVLVEYIGGSVAGTGQQVAAGDAIWSFDYKVIGNPSDTITISSFFDDDLYLSPLVVFSDNSTTENIGSAQIHIIPEPMTIALLGLGGLFLRRKLS